MRPIIAYCVTEFKTVFRRLIFWRFCVFIPWKDQDGGPTFSFIWILSPSPQLKKKTLSVLDLIVTDS